MLKKQFIELKIFLEETLKEGFKDRVNLNDNFIEFNNVYKFYLRPSLFKKEKQLIPLIESLHWANENYNKSLQFRNDKIKHFFDNTDNLIVSYENLYADFLFKLENSINTFFLNKNFSIEVKNNIFTIKNSENKYDFVEINNELNSLISLLFHEFLIKLVEKDYVFFSANYIFISKKDKQLKPSAVNIIVSLMESKIKIINASKLIEVNLLKRAVNRLSLISQKLNDGFKLISSGKAIYKIMFAGRRNAFEEFDRVILESIIQGKE